MTTTINDIPVRTLLGDETTLATWQGKVLLVVNVASKCGFTPQYKGLEELWRKYADRGLVVLGFPCNQFGAQEPGSPEDIASFCSLTYDITFPMFAKVDVNGDTAHPLFQHLKRAQKGILGTEAIKWNFTKFLVGRDGNVIERFASATTPADIEAAIEKALAA
ncbi:MAG: glutathione peroxidase [Candidatus Sericytochromatia bacterium]|nr:glutathione peroxidase [Candidatus Tanganyikabacteria bacterium]